MSQLADTIDLMPRQEALEKIKAWHEQVLARQRQKDEAREPGEIANDGSIMIGPSPDTGKKIYALPESASVTMDFNTAAAYVAELNRTKAFGHDDWRLPSIEELKILADLQHTGAFKGSFNYDAKPSEPGVDPAAVYWSSLTYTQAWLAASVKCINFADGIPSLRPKVSKFAVRAVR